MTGDNRRVCTDVFRADPVPPAELPSNLAVGETFVLLRAPLHLVGVLMGMERERQQNDSLADG